MVSVNQETKKKSVLLSVDPWMSPACVVHQQCSSSLSVSSIRAAVMVSCEGTTELHGLDVSFDLLNKMVNVRMIVPITPCRTEGGLVLHEQQLSSISSIRLTEINTD